MLKSGPGTEESFAPFSERSRKPEHQHELQLELDSGCVLLCCCCWCIRFKTRPFVNWFRVVLAKTQIRKLFWEASTSVGSDVAASTTNQTTGQTVLQDQPRRPFPAKHRRRVVYFALHQLHLSRDANVDCAVSVTVALSLSVSLPLLLTDQSESINMRQRRRRRRRRRRQSCRLFSLLASLSLRLQLRLQL